MSELLCFTLSSLNNSIIKKTLHHFLQVYGLSFAATYGSFKWVSLSASYVAINRKASGRRINKLNCCCLYKISTYSHLSIVAVRGSWMYGLSRSRSHEHHDYNWQLCRHLFISILTPLYAWCEEPRPLGLSAQRNQTAQKSAEIVELHVHCPQHLATFCFNFALLKSGSRHSDGFWSWPSELPRTTAAGNVVESKTGNGASCWSISPREWSPSLSFPLCNAAIP